MRKLLIALVSIVVCSSACSERARRQPLYPAPAITPPLAAAPQPVAPSASSPALSTSTKPALCWPSSSLPTIPGFDLSPFAAAVGLGPCGASGEPEDDASSEALLLPLLVPGHGPAVVSAPRGSLRPRPLIVALHGSYDQPEWQCADMHALVGDRAFVLCPRGIPAALRSPNDEPRFTYGGDVALEVEAAVASLRVTYGLLVDPGPMIYAGYSLGAILGPSTVMPDPARYSRLLLIEGGTKGWNERKFASEGGQRVLFACGLAGCVASASAVAARFVRHGVPSKVAYGHDGGHTRGGPVADAIRADWDWLVEGDPRWAP